VGTSPFLRAVVGLGNPGEVYARTRHNLGFMLVDRIRRSAQVQKKRTLEGVVQVIAVRWADWDLYLVKPLTYMNLSGSGVRLAQSRYGWKPGEILVAYDDVDLPLGRIRLRTAGSAGGHKGMTSVLAALGTDRVPRLRMGIGVNPKPADVAAFVLAPFSADEWPTVEVMLDRAVEVVRLVLAEGFEKAMNWANRPWTDEAEGNLPEPTDG
jgi:PTH1 family peptidyl-tRNA hydrolase